MVLWRLTKILQSGGRLQSVSLIVLLVFVSSAFVPVLTVDSREGGFYCCTDHCDGTTVENSCPLVVSGRNLYGFSEEGSGSFSQESGFFSTGENDFFSGAI